MIENFIGMMRDFGSVALELSGDTTFWGVMGLVAIGLYLVIKISDPRRDSEEDPLEDLFVDPTPYRDKE